MRHRCRVSAIFAAPAQKKQRSSVAERALKKRCPLPTRLCLAGGVDPAKQAEVMEGIKPVARHYADEAKASGLEPEVVFFAATKPGPTATKVAFLACPISEGVFLACHAMMFRLRGTGSNGLIWRATLP